MIGAGLGGLSAAMRLGAKGYRVTIIDRLDRLGGRGSSIAKNGYRFDLVVISDSSVPSSNLKVVFSSEVSCQRLFCFITR